MPRSAMRGSSVVKFLLITYTTIHTVQSSLKSTMNCTVLYMENTLYQVHSINVQKWIVERLRRIICSLLVCVRR